MLGKISNHTTLGVLLTALLMYAGFVYSDRVLVNNHDESAGGEIKIPPTAPEFAFSPAFSSSSVLFLGDILLARNVEFLMGVHTLQYPWASISPILKSFPYVVGNFESAMATPHVRTRAYTTQFSTAARHLPALREAGVTHVSLANNHAFDFGMSGYITAQEQLLNNEITPFGNPTALSLEESVSLIEIDSTMVAIIGIHAVFTQPSRADIEEVVRKASALSDIQIAYVHWGDEYVLSHNTAQESLAIMLVAAGIDTVIGHHPHVTQDIQVIDGVPVFYSLGNFLFDQYFSVDVQQGYMLALTPTAESLRFQIIPISSAETRSKPELMVGVQRDVFLAQLAARSLSSQRENILAGKAIFDFSLASSSQTSIISP